MLKIRLLCVSFERRTWERVALVRLVLSTAHCKFLRSLPGRRHSLVQGWCAAPGGGQGWTAQEGAALGRKQARGGLIFCTTFSCQVERSYLCGRPPAATRQRQTVRSNRTRRVQAGHSLLALVAFVSLSAPLTQRPLKN